jgi:hypothetical protein
MRRQIQISVEVYDAEGPNMDSIEEVEYVISDEANTEDMHRIFMGIAHFLGYSIEGMEDMRCDDCTLCQDCEVRRELNVSNGEKEDLEARVVELKGMLEKCRAVCCPAPDTEAACYPTVDEPPARDWYTPPGER